jgi:rhodanese-related sulfurtransferase
MTNPLNAISPQTAKAMLDDGRAILIDVRERDEWEHEHIPGATLVPLSDFRAARLPSRHGKTVIFHCRSGNRTKLAAAQLIAAGGPDAVYLDGGILSWEKTGYRVEQGMTGGAPIPIMRQVQIAAGALVMLGLILAWLVHPWFLGLSGFVGAGLMLSGVSGTCAMAHVLQYLPWNRIRPGATLVES